MKKSKKQNIILGTIAIIIIGSIVGYNYSVEQTKQKGLKFGNDLQKIQEEVKQIQVDFNSKLNQWEEEDLTKDELLEYSEKHFQRLGNIILKYDELISPETFSASVDLFKLSTQSQLESDKEYIEWIRNNQESNRLRSDSLLQESFEYEMMALGEFNAAKSGIKEYDTPGKFEPPKTDFTDKVNRITDNMIEKCQSKYGLIQEQNPEYSELEKCLEEAKTWKVEHLQ